MHFHFNTTTFLQDIITNFEKLQLRKLLCQFLIMILVLEIVINIGYYAEEATNLHLPN